MSYANVAAHNAPPPALQPHADPGLLNIVPPTTETVDVDAKVHVVPHDYKETLPEPKPPVREILLDEYEDNFGDSKKDKAKKKANKGYAEAKAEGEYLWDTAKHYLLRPGVAGGLIGIVNIGILAGAGRAFYTQPHLRNDRTVIGSTVAGVLALFAVEGFAAERYAQTPRGKDEARRAKKEGALIYKHAREQILRPGVLGGLVGFANTAIIGTVGYFAYTNWEKPHWDRRTVSAVSIGLLALWGGEGYLAEQYTK